MVRFAAASRGAFSTVGRKLSPGCPKLLALLLVGAIVLCHGLLWSLHHQCSAPATPADGTHEHHSHEHHSPAETAGQEEGPGCHPAGADYFVVTLAIFFGMVLGLLLRGGRLWGRSLAPSPSSFRRPLTLPVRIPKSLTPPVSQVFRL